jgi:hypothetical protein
LPMRFERDSYGGSDVLEGTQLAYQRAFDAAGGFDESLPGSEDRDFVLGMGGLGSGVRIAAEILHDEGKVRYLDPCSKKAYYAQGLQRFAIKHRSAIFDRVANRSCGRKLCLLVSRLGAGLMVPKVGQAAAAVMAPLRSSEHSASPATNDVALPASPESTSASFERAT